MTPFAAIRSIEPAGMNGLILYFSGASLTEANQHCQAWDHAIREAGFGWLKDTLPAYDSLLLVFDALAIDNHGVYRSLRTLNVSDHQQNTPRRHHRLPVWYGAPEANDLADISRQTGLAGANIISTHCGTEYRVYAVGFAPGFAYLGEVPDAIVCPRLTTPRDRVPAGAVAIADKQTAVYPQSSPGGWNLLGLCPLSMFDGTQTYSARLSVGDTVSFYPVSEHEYREMKDD
ncbi:5-oxoprolinase subunit B family protein [Alteromonas sp. CYL-A6]|uniref:5-oxoprolinase subunit B family protein n=1 Tax=Alteromonas nitratireducens TaxID=3390813 RepID=UPI0034B9E122